MPPHETPPSSPYHRDLIDGDGNAANPDPNDDGIDEEDIVEVIDLDDALGDPDEDIEEEGMDDEEGEGEEGAAGGSRSGPLEESLPEDNSESTFDVHNKSKLMQV